MTVVQHPSAVRVPIRAPAPGERFLTAGELARFLGVSERQVRRYAAQGMPCERWGRGTVRYLASAATVWLRNHYEQRETA